MSDPFKDASQLFNVFGEGDSVSADKPTHKRTFDEVQNGGKHGENTENQTLHKNQTWKRQRPNNLSLREGLTEAEINNMEDAAAAKLVESTSNNNEEATPVIVKAPASRDSCLHEIAQAPNFDPKTAKPRKVVTKPAKEYPFVLDAFQRESIECIENNESVLVAAHTSAGKTAVAEYAIATAIRDGSRVIYTSPIKALSNQKYREFTEEFKDVGLMTGDVTINPNSGCIVMTTEILRNMLYRGSEILREVSWVIFDEVHYMRDKERGVVWEEVMILLPDTVKFVFLSATIPNSMEFAQWIAKLHNQPCHVIYTEYRPTPLQHYMFPQGGDGIYLIIDEKGRYREDNFQKCLSALPSAEEFEATKKNKKGKKGGTKGPSDVYKIVKMIMERGFAPAIIFSFSKKECEALALQVSKLDFNDAEEKKLVQEVFENAVDSLSDEDKKLPQIQHILPLLKNGIGIHHSGLLPILKEIIEILFQEGLIKVLFSTETFAMGLNMPARTVVFTAVRKWDGKEFRWISSGEYIQMSGRAGRRGKDDRGIVIQMIDQKIEPAVAKNMIAGPADPLNSTFHLEYNMILNLLRVEEVNPEYLMKRSFYQFQNEKARPEMENEIKELELQRDAFKFDNEELLDEYYSQRKALEQLQQHHHEIITQPVNCLNFIQPGRLIKVKDRDTEWGWGVVVNFKWTGGQKTNEKKYTVHTLLECSPSTEKSNALEKFTPVKAGEKGQLKVVAIALDMIYALSSIRIFIPKDIEKDDVRESCRLSLLEVQKRFPDGVPSLDPVEDMHINDPAFKALLSKMESVEYRLKESKLLKKHDWEEQFKNYSKKMEINDEIKTISKHLKSTQKIAFKDTLKQMTRVLRRLGFINQENVIDVKGRVACEVTAGHELLMTELIFSGMFNNMTPEQIVAIASCMVFGEEKEGATITVPELKEPYEKLREMARRIAMSEHDAKIEVDVEEFVNSFKVGIMDVCHRWSSGVKFADICKSTDIFEGSIIRTIRRLEELLREMCIAARTIGDTTLEEKFQKCITKIKRDIVFAASLYL